MPTLDLHSDYIWIDGDLVPFDQARIHFLSPTLHYGMGVTAAMRCYATERGPAVFRLERHLGHFLHAIRALGVAETGHSVTDLRVAVHQTITANGFTDCYVRMLMFLEGGLGLDIAPARTVIGIATWRWDNFWGQATRKHGLRLMISSWTRSLADLSTFPSRLAANYPPAVMAKTLAHKSGFDEAILLDNDGYVADCTGHDLFVVRNGQIHTPPRAGHFGGVTREALITLARDAGYAVREEPLSREQVYVADEVFVCGEAAEVMFVREIDHRPISNSLIGPVTRTLRKAYFDTARGNGRRSAEWLNYVVTQPLY
jgi:branched-chain amino acid aminotransferase